jgi:glycosyltransferase involved in cell wall biosynthesis
MPGSNLLLISYLFPPAGGITVQRALSLARYLPDHGFKVHVLRAGNAPTPVIDRGLLKKIPPEVMVHRSFTPEPPFRLRHAIWRTLGWKKSEPAQAASVHSSPTAGGGSWAREAIKRMICPEPEILWVPFAIRRARKVIQQHDINVVVVTVPPFSALVVGTALKREFPAITLVSDFRDEWLDFYLNESDYQSGEFIRRRATVIEREAVQSSDLVVAVTRPSLERIRRRYPDQPPEKFACIHNGFDPAQFESFQPRHHGTDRVVITHVGTATKASSPKYYLDALEALPPQTRSRIETRFIGRITGRERAGFEGRAVDIRLLGFMPQAEATRYMEETDYLLVTLTDDISLPGKLFEYMATGKPIIAISPENGEVGRILRETGAGWCVDPSRPEALRDLLTRLGAGTEPPICPDWERIRFYERPRMVAEFAATIRRGISSAASHETSTPVHGS